MAIARNGQVELYYESFGSPEAPTLLLVNGLGSQCINYEVPWWEGFVRGGVPRLPLRQPWMGHDYPPAVWPRWIDEWADFVRSTERLSP